MKLGLQTPRFAGPGGRGAMDQPHSSGLVTTFPFARRTARGS
jgi:hypothetical protein